MRTNDERPLLSGALAARAGLLAVVALFATATVTHGASSPEPVRQRPKPPVVERRVVVVPDVRGHAYVFAKGILEDAGFSWRVAGPLEGYATNVVVGTTPAPGTQLVDTGAPTIELTLERSAGYAESGSPENAAPFAGTPVRLAGQAVALRATQPREERSALPPAVVGRPDGDVRAIVAAASWGRQFERGSLPRRVGALARWLRWHRRPTAARIRHWDEQHAAMVSAAERGAREGESALRVLVRLDRHAAHLWRTGQRGEARTRAARADLEERSR